MYSSFFYLNMLFFYQKETRTVEVLYTEILISVANQKAVRMLTVRLHLVFRTSSIRVTAFYSSKENK